MKKHMVRILLTFSIFVFSFLHVQAQGITITKTDGTKVYYKSTYVKSFGVYDQAEDSEGGIVVTRTDGAKVYHKSSEVESVSIYGYGEGPDPNLDRPDTNGYEYVDLGLPSGTLWATMNVGASSPEDYGDYFAWGEIEMKSEYSWSTYKYCNGSETKMTKYCTDSSCGTVDNKGELETVDDVAYQLWGSGWRIPTYEQFEELVNKCTCTWTILNGVEGYMFTSKVNSNSLFFPAAGCWKPSRYNAGYRGYYWSRSLNIGKYTSYSYGNTGAYYMSFSSSGTSTGINYRYQGCSVRPVSSTLVSSFTLSNTTLEMEIGEDKLLEFSVTPSNASNQSVIWSSSNSSVASVYCAYHYYVMAKSVGTATITVMAADGSGVKASCVVTVTNKPIANITLSSSALTLQEGSASQLTATVTPSDATESVIWSTSNATVASISDAGLVTAKSVGTATITATAADGSGVKDSCVVTVTNKPIANITLSSSALSLSEGSTSQLTATVTPSDATNKSVIWSTSNANVATISDVGLITAISVGTAIITCTAADGSGVKAACTVTVKAYNNGHEYVDLGLSVKWATMNVGASFPEDYGDYFAWGETTRKTTYNWSTYKYCNGSYDSLTKYCTDSSYGTVDNKAVLDLSDDAARANWGGTWRMPTDAELTELRTQCTWTWTTQNDVNGYKVTSKNNCNSIFLPAAGYRSDASLRSAGRLGGYWSSSLNESSPYYAWGVGFLSSSVYGSNLDRYYGRSVRPVCP